MVRWLGQRATLLCGLGIGWVGFAIFGLAPTGALFLLGIPLMNLWGLAGPTAQGLMSVHVTPQEQGQLQGAVQCIRGLTALVGPALFTFVFAMAIRPGTVVPDGPEDVHDVRGAQTLWRVASLDSARQTVAAAGGTDGSASSLSRMSCRSHDASRPPRRQCSTAQARTGKIPFGSARLAIWAAIHFAISLSTGERDCSAPALVSPLRSVAEREWGGAEALNARSCSSKTPIHPAGVVVPSLASTPAP